jgi:adenosylhomocysteine nucleosidase
MSRRSDGLLMLTAATGGAALVKISGMGCDRATRAARELVDAGAEALLSWGTAGALDPALTEGTVLLATKVISHDERSGLETHFGTALPWRTRLGNALAAHGPVVEGTLMTAAALVATAEAKAQLFRRTGAMAVDMESAAVAKVAASATLPFMVIRVIVDTARDTLPDALVQMIDAELRGERRRSRLALPLLRAPAQWSQLARLAWQSRSAGRSLRSCARVALAAEPASHWEADA